MSSNTERRDPVLAAAATSPAEVDLGNLAGNATRRAEIEGGGVGTEPGPGEAARYPTDPPLVTTGAPSIATSSTEAAPTTGGKKRVPWRRILGALVAAGGIWALWRDGLIR